MRADGAARRAWSTSASTARADLRLALLDPAEMDEQVAQLLLRVGDRDAQASAPVIVPVSPTWPPLSA